MGLANAAFCLDTHRQKRDRYGCHAREYEHPPL